MEFIKEFFKTIFFLFILSFAFGVYIGGSVMQGVSYMGIKNHSPEIADKYFGDMSGNMVVKFVSK